MAVQDGEVDRAVVPIENSLEGGVAATLDALAGEADDVRIAAEVVHPIHHCLVAAGELALEDDRAGGLPPAGHRPVRPLPARAPAGGRARDRAPPPPRRSAACARATGRWPRSGRACRPSSTAATSWPRTWRTIPTTSPASSGSRAAGRGRRADAARPRPPWSSGASTTSRRARSWTCWPSSRSAASTSRGSSRGRGGCASATTCSSRTSRAPTADDRVQEALDGPPRPRRDAARARLLPGRVVTEVACMAGGVPAATLAATVAHGRQHSRASRPGSPSQYLSARCPGAGRPSSAGRRAAGCSCSTPATSRSTSARCGARRSSS